jgi:hypothetical protein
MVCCMRSVSQRPFLISDEPIHILKMTNMN